MPVRRTQHKTIKVWALRARRKLSQALEDIKHKKKIVTEVENRAEIELS
ncbi:hypothetical protein JV46_00130 [Solemya velum gill symbiont]|uniref:Uncharacterized protein n=1 Tax=Solemya velum gill symbiont TaxID=2340 RepID=A0A0B0H193_SOVGS|nr:hypothetical protein JV46_00130 [Solemya velum gill symbiont]